MDNINYSEVLFQSIDQIIEERLKQIQYDRTIACQVIEAHPDENIYWVNCEGLKLQASSIDPKKTYSKDSMVYVLMPEGNYENTKVIIGGYSNKDIKKKTYNNSYDNFIPNQTFKVIDENNKMILGIKNLEVLETNSIPYNPIEYNQEYNQVGIHWTMQTYQLFDAEITSGKYTLEIVFGNQKAPDEKGYDFDAIVSYPIESSSIYGNPYSLSEEFEQYNLFPYSEKLNNCSCFRIRLYQGVVTNENIEERKDIFIYNKEDEPQIILYSLDLSVGYSNSEFSENKTLNLKKNDSLNYKLQDTENIERTLYFDWRVIDKNKDNQIFNYNNTDFTSLINNSHIYWLKYQENIGYQSFIDEGMETTLYTNIEGLYNWEIVAEDVFKHAIEIDTDYQTDQYKIFIIYEGWNVVIDDENNETQILCPKYEFTNTVIFENLDIAPIQPGASESNKPNSLKLTLNEGNTGTYNVYGLDGRMVEVSKQGPYTITASLFDSLQDKIEEVEWIFPSSNTMVIDARGDDWLELPNYDSKNHNDKLTAKYKIKTQYYSSATFNIIQCKVTMTTGEIRNASVSLQFGEVGNQGTNYSFNIDFIDKDYLTYGEEEELQVKATLSNQNGEEVLLENFINNLEWSWLFVENGNVITNRENSTIKEITSLSNIICSKYENNIVKLRLNSSFDFSQANYSILQAKLKEYNTGDNIKTDLLTYLCVPVSIIDTETIKPRSMQGAARIVYDSLGTATTYSKESYELINEDNTQVANLTWELFTDTKYSGLPVLTESKVKNQENEYITKYKIKPSSYVPPKIPPVSIIAKNGETIYWSQPILITQNTWFNESINEWTNVLSINQQNDGTILAPLLIAGTKSSNNLFTGVTVGQLAIGSKKVNGVYGFSQGKAKFWLNEEAEFYVGDGETKNIHLDQNGNFSIVAKSFDLETTDEKLILSSVSGEFYISDGTNYLQFQKELKEGETITRNSVFRIQANDFEFNNAGYNSFNLEVGKEGFYTGTTEEYISFKKELKEDGSGSTNYYRTLKIKAKEFDFTNDAIGLNITNRGITIGKIPDEGEESSNYINLDSNGKLTMNLDNFTIDTNKFNLNATNLKLSSNNNGEIMIGNDDYYLKFGGNYSTGLNIKTNKFMLDTSTLDINTEATGTNPILTISGRASIGGWEITSDTIQKTYNGKITGFQQPGSGHNAIAVGATNNKDWSTAPFYVTHEGVLYASQATIAGTLKPGKFGYSIIDDGSQSLEASNKYVSTTWDFYSGTYKAPDVATSTSHGQIAMVSYLYDSNTYADWMILRAGEDTGDWKDNCLIRLEHQLGDTTGERKIRLMADKIYHNSSSVASGGTSSLNVKTNLMNIESDYQNLYSDIQNLNLYTYDYKYYFDPNIQKDYGFIIDEIENTKCLKKYFVNIEEEKTIGDNNMLYPIDFGVPGEKIIVKEWKRDSYIKGLFVMNKALQYKIDLLEEEIKGIKQQYEI